MNSPASFLTVPLFGALLSLPWLWAWAPGPSPQIVPLLVAWACLAGAAALWAARGEVRAVAIEAIAAAWLAAAGLSCAMALLQWFGLEGAVPGISGSNPGEAYANLRQRNQFATLTSLGLMALLWIDAQAARARAWPLAAVALLAAGAAASLSRTGLLQWLLICALAAARPGSRRVALAGLVGYAVFAFALPQALAAFTGIEAPSILLRISGELGCSSRTVLWSNVLHLIGLRPWAGWGAGELDFAHFATLYPGERFCDILDNAHNLPLHIAVEFGVPAALLVCGAALAWVVRQRPWAERDPNRLLAWGVLGAIALHSLLEYPLWYGPFQMAALLSLAVLLPLRLGGRTALALQGAAAVMLAGLAWVAVSYDRVSQPYLQPEQRRPQHRADPLAGMQPGPFGAQARFAELSITPLSRESAARVHELATELIHYSPEPRLVEKLIESSVMLGRDDEALWYLARFRAAFPTEHAAWAQRNARPG